MNTALVHDWVMALGGGERCLEVFHDLWPEAPLFTLAYNEDSVRELGFRTDQVYASFVQGFRKVEERYRSYLPFFPLAIEQFDLSEYDVILSSSHCAAKGVLTRADQLHICYCHTPVRYAWDLTHRYLRENNLERGMKSKVARLILHYYRMWDIQTANRVDHFLTNSHYTAQRIWRTYRREAEVIFGPVDIDRFEIKKNNDDYFVFVSRLVSYKRADLVIEAFNRLKLPLKVVGSGPQLEHCKKIAGKNVQVLGYQDDNTVARMMAEARALIFVAEEDFGLVPIEAQACGTPVIAFGKGGIKDTVIPADLENWNEATGVFFNEQSSESLEKAVKDFLRCESHFRPEVLRRNAERFSKDNFKQVVEDFVNEKWGNFQTRGNWVGR